MTVDPTQVIVLNEKHASHHWVPTDDILECANCLCRIYNDEASELCPDQPTKQRGESK